MIKWGILVLPKNEAGWVGGGGTFLTPSVSDGIDLLCALPEARGSSVLFVLLQFWTFNFFSPPESTALNLNIARIETLDPYCAKSSQ